MLLYHASSGAILAWRQAATAPAIATGTVVPRRGWLLLTSGHGRTQISWRRKLSGGSAAHLAVNDATHAHAADALTLGVAGATTLILADATHAHTADVPMLYTDWLLAVADATHGHAADNVALSDAPALAPADAGHGQTADVLALTVAAYLTVQQATHAHRADAIVLGGDFGSEPWPLLAAPGASAHGHGRTRPEQLSTATRSNVQ